MREKVAPLMQGLAGRLTPASEGLVTPVKAVLAMRGWAVQLTKVTVAPDTMVSVDRPIKVWVVPAMRERAVPVILRTRVASTALQSVMISG